MENNPLRTEARLEKVKLKPNPSNMITKSIPIHQSSISASHSQPNAIITTCKLIAPTIFINKH